LRRFIQSTIFLGLIFTAGLTLAQPKPSPTPSAATPSIDATVQAVIDQRFTATAQLRATFDTAQTAQVALDQTSTNAAGLEQTADVLFNDALTATAGGGTATPFPTDFPNLTPLAPDTLAQSQKDGLIAAYALLIRQDFVGAEGLFKQLTADYPDWAEAHRGLGELYMQEGRWQDAVLAFREAKSAGHNDADLYYSMALADLNKGNSPLAEVELMQALALKREVAYMELWMQTNAGADPSYRTVGLYFAAIDLEPYNARLYQRTADMMSNPNSVNWVTVEAVYTMLAQATAAMEAGDAEASLNFLEQAERRTPSSISQNPGLHPKKEWVYYLYARVHAYLLEDYDTAQDYLDRALELDPKFVHAFILRADIIRRDGGTVDDAFAALYTAYQLSRQINSSSPMRDVYEVLQNFPASWHFSQRDQMYEAAYLDAITTRHIPWAYNPSGYHPLPYLKLGWTYHVALPEPAASINYQYRAVSGDLRPVNPMMSLIHENGLVILFSQNSLMGIISFPQGAGNYRLNVALREDSLAGAVTLYIESSETTDNLQLIQTLTPTPTLPPDVTATPTPTYPLVFTRTPSRTPLPTSPRNAVSTPTQSITAEPSATPTASSTPSPTGIPTTVPRDSKEAILQAQALYAEAHRLYAFTENGDYEPALDLLDEAQRVAPLWPYSYVLEGVILHDELDEPRIAITNYELAMRLGADLDPAAYTHYKLAEAYYTIEEYDNALRLLEIAVERRPYLIFVIREYAWTLYKLGRYAEAIAISPDIQRREPDSLEIIKIYRGSLLATSGKAGEMLFQTHLYNLLSADRDGYKARAISLCEDSFENITHQILQLTLCTNFYVNIGEYDKARELADQLLEISPDDPYSLMTRARIEVFAGRPQDAIELYEQLYALNPINSVIIFRRINANRMAGIELPPEQYAYYFDTHVEALWPWLLDENGQAELTYKSAWGYIVEFSGKAGDTFTITGETGYYTQDLPPILVIKDADGNVLAGTSKPMGTASIYELLNTQLENFELPADGTYTVWVGLPYEKGGVRLTVKQTNQVKP